MGKVGMANIIALGCMAEMNAMVAAESLAEVIQERFSGTIHELNLKALQAGIDLGKNSAR
jgi:Pyruvate/2-oxoacid:ferredoxin oxidoreductase gamma subunit